MSDIIEPYKNKIKVSYGHRRHGGSWKFALILICAIIAIALLIFIIKTIKNDKTNMEYKLRRKKQDFKSS